MRFSYLVFCIGIMQANLAMGSISLSDRIEAVKTIWSNRVSWETLKSERLPGFLQNHAKLTVEAWQQTNEEGYPAAPDSQVKELFSRMLSQLGELGDQPISSLAEGEDSWLWPKIFEKIDVWAGLLHDESQKTAFHKALDREAIRSIFYTHGGNYVKFKIQNLAILTSALFATTTELSTALFQPWDVPHSDRGRFIQANQSANLATEDQKAQALASMFAKFLLPRLATPNFDAAAKDKLALTWQHCLRRNLRTSSSEPHPIEHL